MNVLVACEFSGVVREAFRKRGHNAFSCDFLPAADGRWDLHYTGNALDLLPAPKNIVPRGLRLPNHWDLLIAHPTCTYLCNSGVHLLVKTPKNPGPNTLHGSKRMAAMKEACTLFNAFLLAPIPKICVENPIMHGYARALIAEDYAQIIQPHQFGHDASKQTCLWLKGLPKLIPTKNIPPKIVNGRKIWGNQTPSGQNKLGPSADRWAKRSITYQGIADAMAEQWG